MLICRRNSTNPFENIAAEEWLTRHIDEDLCMLWQNEPAVVIGKHQNAYGEINYPFIKQQQVPVIRRISGGGAVYHDLGNLNFTFIERLAPAATVGFGRYTGIIVQFMQSLGLKVETGARNSIYIDGSKFSGHAQHLYRGKVLHHGTLLFDTDLTMLNSCLTPARSFETKALPSARSRVANLSPLLPQIIDIQHFTDVFLHWLTGYFAGSRLFELSEDQLGEIRQLAEAKYKSWQWNFGYSPKYAFTVPIKTRAGILELGIEVKDGIIAKTAFMSGHNGEHEFDFLHHLEGINHNEQEISRFANEYESALSKIGIDKMNFIDTFFV